MTRRPKNFGRTHRPAGDVVFECVADPPCGRGLHAGCVGHHQDTGRPCRGETTVASRGTGRPVCHGHRALADGGQPVVPVGAEALASRLCAVAFPQLAGAARDRVTTARVRVLAAQAVSRRCQAHGRELLTSSGECPECEPRAEAWDSDFFEGRPTEPYRPPGFFEEGG